MVNQEVGQRCKSPHNFLLNHLARQSSNSFQRVFSSSLPSIIPSNSSSRTTTTDYVEEEITVEGVDVPAPFLHFKDYEWPQEIRQYLENSKYSNPTSIQAQGWPICLEGRDCIGIAQTGSGKTLAYLLPALIHIDNVLASREVIDPIAVILAPTRELATQIAKVAEKIDYYPSVALYGGQSRNVQYELLQKYEPKLVIATPGRFKDMMDSQMFYINDVSYVVLDEADRMLDMGFEAQIRSIMGKLPRDRQTVMWTATWPKEVRAIAKDYMKPDAVHVYVGSKEIHANPNITQNVIVCDTMQKDQHLIAILKDIMNREKDTSDAKILIFAATKSQVDRIPRRVLRQLGLRGVAIHGNKTQAMRTEIYEAFKSGKYRIMVATDVAARGLDVQNIKYVINYDMPYVLHDYVHRIGRTGRHGLHGYAYSLITPEQRDVARGLIDILKENNQPVSQELQRIAYPDQRNRKQRSYNN